MTVGPPAAGTLTCGARVRPGLPAGLTVDPPAAGAFTCGARVGPGLPAGLTVDPPAAGAFTCGARVAPGLPFGGWLLGAAACPVPELAPAVLACAVGPPGSAWYAGRLGRRAG